jgi:hypothetical protein
MYMDDEHLEQCDERWKESSSIETMCVCVCVCVKHCHCNSESFICITYATISPASHPFTRNPTTNKLFGQDIQNNPCGKDYKKSGVCSCCKHSWLGCVIYSEEFLKPIQAEIQVIPVKVKSFNCYTPNTFWKNLVDVSDHYPVLATLQ